MSPKHDVHNRSHGLRRRAYPILLGADVVDVLRLSPAAINRPLLRPWLEAAAGGRALIVLERLSSVAAPGESQAVAASAPDWALMALRVLFGVTRTLSSERSRAVFRREADRPPARADAMKRLSLSIAVIAAPALGVAAGEFKAARP